MQELREVFDILGSAYDSKTVAGALSMVAVFIVMLPIVRRHKVRYRRVEKAIRLGHVVPAERIRFRDWVIYGKRNESTYHATYRYEVNGKRYEYNYCGKHYPEKETNLYYVRSPRFAFMKVPKTEVVPIILLVVLPLFVGVFVMICLS